VNEAPALSYFVNEAPAFERVKQANGQDEIQIQPFSIQLLVHA
jgi:hypothetical protein